ncbi:thioredoxin family protein [Dokdonia sinensis]|uniref:Thioredoxin family protein n=1 Tax=Dokdonia sinensis TaxID=2479847 RepID=A0A3M0GFC4_9FLAO|nr:thioredoxin family protein [Dokdonia sinensis]RMB63454.1 thioredoxin family protein [Dokdonia sinensis]
MEVMTKTQLIEEALSDAISYQDYRALTEKHALEGTNTGQEITDALANYTLLNHKRMKRLDKTLKISPEMRQQVENYDRKVTWLVLTESWCGDAAQTMPMMQKFADLNKSIDFKVILRDEHLELMDEFLYNGGRSIPKLIAIDTTTREVIGNWGPRPSQATQLVDDYKRTHGSLTPEFKEDLQVWYNKDKGQNTARDLIKLLK